MNEKAKEAMMENKELMEKILAKIKEYDRIMLFRHSRMDGDCVGASKGFQTILKNTFPDKEILLVDEQRSDYLAFMGEDTDTAPDDFYRDALGIVVDTSIVSRISNPKYALCKEIIKIDHHIDAEPYGDISWVEPERSSACEMITAFYSHFCDQLVMTPEAALYLYTGMVTDSGRFRFEGVKGDTLRLAGLLLDQGIDTETLYANLYLSDFESLRFKSYVFENMQRTENGVASIYISRQARSDFGLSYESASAAVSYLDSIKGSLCWLAFIESDDDDGSIRVRLRSRFMTINTVAEHFHGGGHACASGATVYSQDEMNALIAEADAAIKEYKETHEGWL